MAKDKQNGAAATTAQRGQYTVLEQINVTIPGVEGTDDTPAVEPQDVQAFVVRGEVSARSKNDAIRTAFNESKINGAGTYAAVTSRSFAPIAVEPKQRTALTWG